MNKIFILGLTIGVALSLETSKELSPCAKASSIEDPEECFSLETEFFQQTCCFFNGTYKDPGKKEKKGGACLEAYKSDVSTGKRKAETQAKIEKGEYWENYEGIKDIESFLCFDTISECEKNQPAENEEQCFSSYPELTSETCCYIESDWVEPDFYGEGKEKHEKDIIRYCVDIDKGDSKNLDEVQKKILDGTYWEGYPGHPTRIEKFKCFSISLNINLLALALVLFIF